MPSVISNSSPLIHLAKIGQLHLLPQIFSIVTIPTAVYEECTIEGQARDEVLAIKNAEWLNVCAVNNQDLVQLLYSELDRGESEALTLALEKSADLILLDDAEARAKARLYKLRITGTIGILLRAYQENRLSSLPEVIEQLQVTGFWIDNRLKAQILAEIDK